MPVPADGTAPASSGLVGALGFDEASGSVATDASPEGNVGLLQNGVARTDAGRFGRGLSFDGVDDDVAIDDTGTFEEPGSLDMTVGMTLEAWVNPSDSSGWETVLFKETGSPAKVVYALYAGSESSGPVGEVVTDGVVHRARAVMPIPTGEWTHLAVTYDGSDVRLYVDGEQAASEPATGAMENSSRQLWIGRNPPFGEQFTGRIDEVRVYDRALSASELSVDMQTPVSAPAEDVGPPSAPGALTAAGSRARADLSWTAAHDDVRVAHYDVYRSTAAGFTPTPQDEIAETTDLSLADRGLPAGTFHYRVSAVDAVGNVGPPSNEASVTVDADTVAPQVALTGPADGAVVSGSVPVTADASDETDLRGVTFMLDGAPLGDQDTEAPWSLPWDTRTVGNGRHVLTAVAQDATGHQTESAPVTVVVDNNFSGFEDTLVASLPQPTAIDFLPDGGALVATQRGKLLLVRDGQAPATALDLGGDGSALCTEIERGLLGVAVDPDFASNRFVYLYYTRHQDGACVNRVSRFTLGDDGNVEAGSEYVLLDGIPSTAGDHNAGDVEFGKDGYLYVSIGDGGCDYLGDSGCGSSNDAARDRNVLLGKIVRITKTGGIPPDNPFLGAGTARCQMGATDPGKICQETYAWGLRNPFRIAFDPNAAGTRFFIDDVGQNRWEEVDEGQAGADYGWNFRSGPCPNGSQSSVACPPEPPYVDPIFSYNHDSGCSAITGGAFVPDSAGWPAEFKGQYLYADYVCGTIFRLSRAADGTWSSREFLSGLGNSSAVALRFGPYAGPGQALYYTTYANGGQLRRIAYVGTADRAPVAVATATPSSGAAPLQVQFDASGSHDPDPTDTLTYAWDLDGDGQFDDSTDAKPTWTYETGDVTVEVRVSDGRGGSDVEELHISAGNTAPVAEITGPPSDLRFAVGQSITITGTGTDAQDGTLPGTALHWTVLRHHVHNDPADGAEHTHPFLDTTGDSITITAPPPEDIDSTIGSYLEVILTVTDSHGVKDTVSRKLLPNVVALTFASTPPGRSVTVAGDTLTTPATVASWEGWNVDVHALDGTDGSGVPWAFGGWADGGADATRTITTPAAAATFTAAYDRVDRAPAATATADPTTGVAPLSVSLDASGSSDPDGDALSYAWDLDGDGQFDDATGVSPRATFGRGTHVVSVRVDDGHGRTATAGVTVTVADAPPVAVARADRTSGIAPLTVHFDASGSSDPDGDALSYAWDLDGDGRFDDATVMAPQRVFGVGTHVVSLRVDDRHGATATQALTLRVTAPKPGGTGGTTGGTGGISGTTGGTGATTPWKLTLTVARTRLGRLLSRGLRLGVPCPEACALRGRLLLHGRTVGAGKRTSHAAGTTRLTLHVKKAARRRLRHMRRAKLVVRVRATTGDGTTAGARRTIVVRR